MYFEHIRLNIIDNKLVSALIHKANDNGRYKDSLKGLCHETDFYLFKLE
jgi:hypothetical protein